MTKFVTISTESFDDPAWFFIVEDGYVIFAEMYRRWAEWEPSVFADCGLELALLYFPSHKYNITEETLNA